ncbi:MAG: hypothetical protein WA891_15260 [Acidobacteriaceae bacterium]|jgi:hypothetical protein
MERNEPKYAQDLFEGLTARFAAVADQAQIAITGGGVQWRCSAQRGPRSCWTGCFEVGGPEFLTFFEDAGRRIATARTSSCRETVDAIWHWLDSAPLPAMYQKFCFVDWEKRKLLSIRETALTGFPKLGTASQNELTVTPSGVSHLWFRNDGRSAHIHFATRHESPQANFGWDDSELFRFNAADPAALGAVLAAWLADNAPPSKLRKDFPWLQIGPLADYYEKGNPVEGEFIESWNQMEEVYGGSRFPPRTLVLPFIADLRRAGYDRQLRAGQSIWSLIVSRSRRPRLRPEQPLVSFQFRESSMEVYSSNEAEERIFEIPIGMSDTVERVLQRLVTRPID